MIRRINLLGLAVVVALVGAWQLAVGGGLVSFDYVPAPSSVLHSLVTELRSGQLAAELGHTVSVTLRAWLLALAAGVVAGLALASSPPLRAFFGASVDALRTIPVVALLPIALLIWGPSATSELAVAAVAAVWPVLVSTESGVRAVHPRLAEVAATLRLSRFDAARKIALPAAAPEILVGARIALGFALVVAVVAEMVGNPQGLGYQLVVQQQALNPSGMWAYVVVIGALGVALNAALVAITRLAMPGRRHQLGTAGG